MSDALDTAVTALNAKLAGAGFDGTAKFVLEGVGAVIIDANGARLGDDETDVTLTASPDVFQSMLAGDLNPTAAFMTGKLSVDGDMGAAMRLGGLLS